MTTTARAARTTSTALNAALAAAASAVLVLAGPQLVGWQGYLWVLPLPVAAAAVYGAVVDARTRQLPNALTGPLGAAGAVQVAGSSLYVGVEAVGPLLAAAAVVFVVYVLMAAAGWCGFGDAKFAGALALFVGLYVGLLAIYLIPVAIVFGSIHMLVAKAISREPVARIPQGPAIAAAALIIMALGLALFG
ncbi:prepilin peptidase [Microbacterium sp. ZOR0019]|uniref:prepilin peptidase n=1 Tax=Microbacterium sp. ZOR0019 TaxID=1339233 RepID=UPI00068A4516|nr:prepilin peptidase [Microbacterium sp. ZOR0019]